MSWPSLSEHIQAKAESFPQRVFLEDWPEGSVYTFREFAQTVSRMAWALREKGVKAGDRVAILHPNHSDFILACGAVIHAGAVAVPVNPLYTPGEVSYILSDSAARALITTTSFWELVNQATRGLPELRAVIVKQKGESLFQALKRECGAMRGELLEPRAPQDLAFIFYTSGTTGKPKGVMLTHRNLVFGGANTAQNYGLVEGDSVLLCLPLVHIFANASPVLGVLNSGGRVVVMERFQSLPVLEALERAGITWFAGVPTMFAYLLEAMRESPRRLSKFRMGLSGGASLSSEHLRGFQESFGVPVLEVYGLTESTGLVTGNPVYGIRKAGSVGIQVSGVTVKLVDDDGREVPTGEVGELVFRGPNATVGYWRLPEATREAIRDGWVFTRDLARADEEGYYFIVGRKDELIICGGYNLYPREIEEVLSRHPAVAEAAVVGIADRDLGQVPKAFVVPKPGCALEPRELLDFCGQHLARYKLPRDVEVRVELPKSSTGKILKKALS